MTKLELTRLDLAPPKEAKPWYKSKTVWFNMLLVLGPTLDALVGMFYMMEPFIAPGVYPFIVLGIGLVNVVLRTITTQALAAQQEEDWRKGRGDAFVD